MLKKSMLALILVPLLFANSCAAVDLSRKPEDRIESIANPSSILLPMLLTKSDFPGEFKDWYFVRVITRQDDVTPTVDNHHNIQSALREFTVEKGLFREYYIIRHELWYYDQKVDWTQSAIVSEDRAEEVFSLDLMPSIHPITDKCVRSTLSMGTISDTTVKCDVNVHYPNIISSVFVFLPGEMSQAEVADFLNHILEQIDGHINTSENAP